MGVVCINKCMRYALLSLNILLFITGLTFFIGGVFVVIKAIDYPNVFEPWSPTSVLCITLGLWICIVSFLGGYGATKVRNYRYLLYTFGIFVFIGMVLEILTALYLIANMGTMNKNVHEGFENAMSKYKPEDSKDVVTSVIDNIQRTLECCGAKGPNDWQKFYVADAVPLSCCPPQSSMYTPCLADRTFAKGCILELDKVIKYNVVSLSFILFVVALLQLVAVSIACYLIQ